MTGTPRDGRPKQCRHHDRQRHDGESDRLSRQQPFAEQQEQERNGADRQDEQIDVAELTGEPDRAVEEIVAAAGNAEQARQLAHDDGESGAGLEADQNAVADQANENAEFEKPGDQAKQRHGAGRKACDLRISHRIPAGQRPDSARNHQRDRGGRADRKLARRPKQRIADAAKHIAVDADLRRQAGQRRIGQ